MSNGPFQICTVIGSSIYNTVDNGDGTYTQYYMDTVMDSNGILVSIPSQQTIVSPATIQVKINALAVKQKNDDSIYQNELADLNNQLSVLTTFIAAAAG